MAKRHLDLVGGKDHDEDAAKERFFHPASDDQGHNERLFFRVPPGVARDLTSLIQSRDYPYQTASSCLRHALIRHLDWLSNPNSDASNYRRHGKWRTNLHAIMAIEEILEAEAAEASFMSIFQKLGETIATHMSRGSVDMARDVALRVYAQVAQMPVGPWKERYMREIVQRFGGLIDGKPGWEGQG